MPALSFQPMRSLLIILAVTCSLGLVSGCATNPATGSTELVFMSEEEELKLGRELHQVIIKQIPLYDDPRLQRYVQQVGERVTKTSHRTDLFYRFHVLDRPEVNAFALPGGYIYIFRGLLSYLNSEAELAAVLGHEAGHVTARHAVRQHRNSVLAQILATAVAIQTGSQPYADLSSILGAAAMSGYGRELELEADRFGAEYLARSGYDIEAMLRVIEVLKSQEEVEKVRAKKENREPAVYHGVFSTHPENDDRLKTVVRAAKSLQIAAQPEVGRDAYLQMTEGMVIGASAKEGIARAGRFYHKDFDISFAMPAGWRLENEPNRALLIAPDGLARIQLSAEDQNKRVDGATFAKERLNIKGLKDESSRDVNGLPCYRARYPESLLGAGKHIELAIFYVGERALIFQAANKDSDKQFNLRPVFDEVVASFRRIQPDEAPLAEPLRQRSETVRAGDNYAAYAKASPLPGDADTELRLMNHQYPAGEPAAGSKVKLVK